MIPIIELIVLAYSVILHEIAHGFVAEKLGDPTPRLSGRLTLDPRPHIDPLMTIAMPLLLILVGSPFIFGGAKPVPIDPYNFRNTKKDIALTALAGPMTNFLIALILSIIIKTFEIFFPQIGLTSIASFFANVIVINIFLGIFNFLPIPPLDGAKVLGGILPDEFLGFWYSLEKFGFLIVILFVFFFTNTISDFVYPATNALIHFLL